MPLYEYECENGHVTELYCSSHHKADGVMGMKLCKSCKGKLVKRRTFPSSVSIEFKGPGFYKNEYKKGS